MTKPAAQYDIVIWIYNISLVIFFDSPELTQTVKENIGAYGVFDGAMSNREIRLAIYPNYQIFDVVEYVATFADAERVLIRDNRTFTARENKPLPSVFNDSDDDIDDAEFLVEGIETEDE